MKERTRPGRRCPGALRAGAGLFVGLGALLGPAWGLINPKFTPRHLVQQSDAFLVLKVKSLDAQGSVRTEVLRAIKGTGAGRPPVLDLTTSAFEEQARLLRSLLKQVGDSPIVLVTTRQGRANLHVTVPRELGRWFAFERGKGNVWEFEKMDTDMQGVWAGASDMLVRLAEQIARHPEAQVPINAGCKWTEANQRIGRVKGKVCGAMAVELGPRAPLALHVASEGGDRLFRYDPRERKFRDITGKTALAAASRAWAWGDFDADGRVDLASWDGGQLRLWLRSDDGTFHATSVRRRPAGDCLGLALVGCVAWPRPGLLWSGRSGPVLLVPAPDGLFRPPHALDLAGTDLAKLGTPGRCLVADLNADGLPDVLWPCAHGGLLFRGRQGGRFERATPSPVAVGGERGAAFPGDFDADGLLDVLAVSENPCRIWQNRGAAGFEDAMVQSGEIEHVYNGKGIGGNTCDFNGDGRQDVFIAYADREPQLFFNRGFRSFGHAHELDLAEARRLPEAHRGVQAGLVADLNADGAQDMAIVLPGGDVWIILRDSGEPPLTCRAVLPPGKGHPGPLSVTAWDGNICLGAWNVTAGGSRALFGKTRKGPLRLVWRLPGAKEQSTSVIVRKPIRVELPTGQQPKPRSRSEQP